MKIVELNSLTWNSRDGAILNRGAISGKGDDISTYVSARHDTMI